MRITFCQLVFLGVALLTTPAFSADPPLDSPEQKVLDKWVGKWQTTYKMSIAGVISDKTVTAEVTAKRILGGRYVQETSEHSDKNSGMFILTYDPEQKRYRGWWFSSTGPTGEYAGEWDEASQTMTMTGVRVEPATISLTHHFEDDDHAKWKLEIKDGSGKTAVHMQGTTIRVKESKGD